MDIRIHPLALSGALPAPPSKSASHRAALCAALAEGTSLLRGMGESRDIRATLAAVRALGASAEEREDALAVTGISGIRRTQAEIGIDCDESGSTLRFLLPVAAALGARATFSGHGRLPARPIGPLADAMARHGVTFTRTDGMPFTIEGRLTPGRYSLAGNVSSQFITGLLYALPLLEGDSEIILSSPLESAGYVEMTLQALRACGVRVTATPEGWSIPGGQRVRAVRREVEADYSNAAFWLCAGALTGPVACGGLDPDSAQGDRAILPLLEAFGARVDVLDGFARTACRPLRAITIDAGPVPDLVPILAVTAAAAQGATRIVNAARLRIKECDRLAAMARCLTQLGVIVEESADALRITGGRPLHGGVVDGCGDHRIVMAAAIAASVAQSDVTITGAQAVEKSYPDFFAHYKRLGGEFDVL